MARRPIQPEGIPKPITPSTGPATDPMDQGDAVPHAEPRPAATASPGGSAERGTWPGASRPAAGKPGRPEQRPSDAAPPVDEEGPLESLGKAVSAPVREAAGDVAEVEKRAAPSGRDRSGPR
jgi:hypothetical protein